MGLDFSSPVYFLKENGSEKRFRTDLCPIQVAKGSLALAKMAKGNAEYAKSMQNGA